jgi:photosystem II stability/assembly factor-like uncharacterized protein
MGTLGARLMSDSGGQTVPRKDANVTPAAVRLRAFDEHLKLKLESVFKSLTWRNIGPIENSGRITDVAVAKGRPYTYYCATASGGVWKTANNGTTWEPIWDDAPSSSVGDIAVSESNPDIVWIGAGEANCRWWSYSGTGMYKSTDAGRSWAHMGLSETHTIGRIVIDPRNPDIVYVAAMGHMYTRNEERGVFKTTDGGKTWAKVLFIDDGTGAIDLVMDPSDPKTLYAAAWERIRMPWRITEYGKGSGLYKSADGGATWRRIENGFPTGAWIGRIGLDVSPSNPNVVYALLDNYNDMSDPRALKRAQRQARTLKLIVGAEVYRSDSKGESWRKVNEDDIADLNHIPFNYGFYFGQIRVSPDNENEIFILGAPLFHSADGGKTFKTVSHPALYGDHHAMWIDPSHPDHIIDGNDGGLNVSYDRGKTWQDIKMPLGQCYSLTVDMDEPYHVYTSLQDGMSWFGSVASIPGVTEAWRKFPGGERSALAFDFSDYQTLYSTAGVNRIDRKTWTAKNIEPRDFSPELRKNWFPPLIVSPHNPRILYFGTQMLMRSLDRGDRWQAISPDLTAPDPRKQGTVHVQYSTITSISESPFRFGLIYAGTDDGQVQVTQNGGLTWEKIMDQLPAERWVSRILASQHDERTVYVTFTGLRNDDLSAYVFKSKDCGKHWASISQSLPGSPANVIREDPKNPNVLYLGTDIGVYVSADGGLSWSSLGSNLPTAVVNDLVVHPRDRQIVIGTHGRSVYVVDVNPIQELDKAVKEKAIHLFSINPVYAVADNGAKQEAPVYFYLREARSVKVEIARESGEIIRTLEVQGRPGVNAAIWDLKSGGQPRNVPPGKYAVRLSAGNDRERGIVEIKSYRGD